MARSVRPAPLGQEPEQTLDFGNLCNFLTIERTLLPEPIAMYADNPSTSIPGGSSSAAGSMRTDSAARAADVELAQRRARALEAANGEERGRALAFGAGIAVGALIGAGLALLLAPQSGEATRAYISRSARRIPDHARDRWDDLGDELRMALRRRTRGMRRGVRNARWAAADAVEG